MIFWISVGDLLVSFLSEALWIDFWCLDKSYTRGFFRTSQIIIFKNTGAKFRNSLWIKFHPPSGNQTNPASPSQALPWWTIPIRYRTLSSGFNRYSLSLPGLNFWLNAKFKVSFARLSSTTATLRLWLGDEDVFVPSTSDVIDADITKFR